MTDTAEFRGETQVVRTPEAPFVVIEWPGEAALTPAAVSALAEIRRLTKIAMENDPEFAAQMRRPIIETDPSDPLLDRLRAGEFR